MVKCRLGCQLLIRSGNAWIFSTLIPNTQKTSSSYLSQILGRLVEKRFNFLLSLILPTASPSYLLSNTRKKYGESTCRTIRHVEYLTKKLQKAKCDVEFNRACLPYNLKPRFLELHLWKKKFTSSDGCQRLKRQSLLHEFDTRHKATLRLGKDLRILLPELEKRVTTIDYCHIKKHLHETATQQRNRTMQTHQKKLEQLNKGPVGQDFLAMKSKVVHNISSYTVTDAEERLLWRGWEFCIEHRLSNFLNFKTDIEQNALLLEPICHPTAFNTICRQLSSASDRYMSSMRKRKFRNLTDEEVLALRSLKQNSDIIISRAEKGNAIVVMNKNDYVSRAQTILSGKQFRPITNKKIGLECKEKEMNTYLRELYNDELIDKKLFWRLHSTSASLSVMYGQPKIDKAGYPMRPIISSIGSYHYQVSKYLAELLYQHRTERPASYIKDSFTFVDNSRKFSSNDTQTMCSFDVESLYTNVPVSEAIEIALDELYKKATKVDNALNRDQMRRLSNFAVRDIPFRLLNDQYSQANGVAMGSPLAPILADLFMSKMEQKLNRLSTNRPKIWLMYVDDVFCVFEINVEKIHAFPERINNWHPNLRFTIELEQNKQLPFLDVCVIRENSQHTTTLYRKPTHTDLYLLWESNQCRKYKLGLIKTLMVRILRICSTPQHVQDETERLRRTLKANGYSPHIIKRGIREGDVIVTRLQQQPQQTTVLKKKRFLTSAYYGHETMILTSHMRKTCQKLLRHIDLHVSFKKQHTLKQTFLPIQKGLDESKKNKQIIYKIPCKNDDLVYIGETARDYTTRMKEHQTAIKKNLADSDLAKHVNNEKHEADFTNVETIGIDSIWRRRIIKESLLTQQHLGETINQVKHNLRVFG